MIRTASEGDRALYPFGGGTMLDYGLPPTRPGYAVDLRGLDQVIDYPARDMTITVQAGITISRLQEVLRGEGQRLPIDVPLPERATLGGAVACNVSGPRRYEFGTLRDYVIGISAMNGLGQEIKAGGRVVKNVAGYDLCKLFTGSLGTLGIITQLTLKVRPLPEQSTLLGLSIATANLEALLETFHTSRTRPACLEVLSDAVAREVLQGDQQGADAGWVVLVGFEDNHEAVAWQVRQVKQELASTAARALSEWSDAAAEPIWSALRDFPLVPEAQLTFKANLLPSALTDFLAKARPHVPRLQAHAGNGIVMGHFASDVEQSQAETAIDQLRAQAVAAQGNLVLLRCPAEWKSVLQVWGRPRGDAWLMRAVKQQLDPRGLFNPGRFLAEI